MAEAALGTGIWYFNDPDSGRPISLGSVYVGVADLDPKIEANRVTVTLIQEDGARVNILPSVQPLQLGAGGNIMNSGSAVVVKVADTVSVRVDDSLGAQKVYVPFYNESSITDVNERVTPVNGSFENELSVAGIPDSWSVVPSANGTISVDSAISAHGLKSLKFNSTDAGGAGEATSDRFNVLSGGSVRISFSYYSTAIDTRNRVSLLWYDASESLISTVILHDNSATNPLAFKQFTYDEIAPLTAVRASIKLDGVIAGATTVIADTWFDDIAVNPVNSFGSFEVTGASVNTISLDNLALPANRPIEVDVYIVGMVSEAINVMLNLDAVDINYYRSSSFNGGSAGFGNSPLLTTLPNNTDCAIRFTINPNSTQGNSIINSNTSYFDTGTNTMTIVESGIIYTISDAITSIGIRNGIGANIGIGSTIRYRLK